MQSASRSSLVPRLIRLAVPLGLIALAAALLLSTRKLEAHNRQPPALAIGPIVRYSPLAVLPSECSARIAAARVPVDYTLSRGETLAKVLLGVGFNGEEVRQVTAVLAARVSLRKLKAGNRYSAFWNPDSTLAALDLTLDGDGRVEMNRDPDGQWRLDWLPFRRSIEVRAIQGILDEAARLETAVQRAGGPAGLAVLMAEALQWDLDFARDLRHGDRFRAMYEAVQLDGKDHAVGKLLALVYENRGRRYEAYRFGDGTVFFDASGQPLQKMFLRSPLRFTHVTSSFSARRLHPVLHEVRPHNGIDLSAPVGTPVEVTASGTVVFAGWDGGGGNVVKVQHGPDYVTAYLHLSRFARGVHPGARVRQGDTIAYTGATGLATGPHLDYRVRYRGSWIDPLALKGVRDQPIPRAQLAAFDSWRDAVRSGLERGVVPAVLATPGSRSETLLAGVATAAGNRGGAGSIMIRRSAPLRGRSAADAAAVAR
jgi:murein DD-endopeptidase MepM/ murein hydrolase activator NlpD